MLTDKVLSFSFHIPKMNWKNVRSQEMNRSRQLKTVTLICHELFELQCKTTFPYMKELQDRSVYLGGQRFSFRVATVREASISKFLGRAPAHHLASS